LRALYGRGRNRGEAVNALKRAIYTGRVAPTKCRPWPTR
jgi:hypothetical protein